MPKPEPTKLKKTPSLDVTKEIEAANKVLTPAVKRIIKALQGLDITKLPMGTLADFLYELSALRKQVSVLATPFEDVIPEKVKEIEEHFKQTLEVGESSGQQGMRARVQITESLVPTVAPENWEKFWTWAVKNKQFDLLPHSVKVDAVRERWDNKKNVPHVGKFNAKKVSCTKLRGK